MKIDLGELQQRKEGPEERAESSGGAPCVLVSAQESFVVASAETTIGSGAGCDIRLTAEGVEEAHAALVRRDSQYYLVDRSQSRETRHGGLQLCSARLQSGDVIVFGDRTFGVERGETGWALVGRGERFEITHGAEVGRLASCAVPLDTTSISRRHARFSVEGGELLVSDLGSSNGTRTGDRRLGEVPLQIGDHVQIGSVELELQTPEADPAMRMFELVVGDRPQILMDGIHRIGRSPDCEVWLDDEAVSRYHAEICVGPDGILLRDLGSSNGSRVDGRRVNDSVSLGEGALIEVAKHRLQLRSREIPQLPEGTVQLDLDEWDKTRVLIPGDVAQMSEPLSEPVSEPQSEPSEKSLAQALLGVDPGAERSEIERRYRSLCSDYQLRLQNAPTPRLRANYEEKLAALREARDCLVPDDTVSRLPTARPIEVGAVGREVVVGFGDAGVDVQGGESRVEPASPGGGEVPVAVVEGEPVTAPRRVPVATLWMAAAALVMAVANAAVASLFFSTHGEEVALSARRDVLVAGIESATRDGEAAAIELAQLEPAVGPLLENGEFKFCNLSEVDVQITWLAVAALPAGGDALELWDTSEVGYEPFFVSSGSAWRGEVVRGESTLWGGEHLFFAATVWDGVEEVLHGGSAYELGGDCFKLDLD